MLPEAAWFVDEGTRPPLTSELAIMLLLINEFGSDDALALPDFPLLSYMVAPLGYLRCVELDYTIVEEPITSD